MPAVEGATAWGPMSNGVSNGTCKTLFRITEMSNAILKSIYTINVFTYLDEYLSVKAKANARGKEQRAMGKNTHTLRRAKSGGGY